MSRMFFLFSSLSLLSPLSNCCCLTVGACLCVVFGGCLVFSPPCALPSSLVLSFSRSCAPVHAYRGRGAWQLQLLAASSCDGSSAAACGLGSARAARRCARAAARLLLLELGLGLRLALALPDGPVAGLLGPGHSQHAPPAGRLLGSGSAGAARWRSRALGGGCYRGGVSCMQVAVVLAPSRGLSPWALL